MKTETMLIVGAVGIGLYVLSRPNIVSGAARQIGTEIGASASNVTIGAASSFITTGAKTLVKTEDNLMHTLFIDNKWSPVNWAIQGGKVVKSIGNDDKWFS